MFLTLRCNNIILEQPSSTEEVAPVLRTRLALLLLAGACTGDGASTPPPNVANGELEPWQAAAPLPTARANHCSAVVGDTLLVIGGNRKVGSDFVKTDEIHAATIAPDGTLTWTLAGHAPSPVTECTATADGNTLYLIDGLYDRESDGRTVFTATLDPATHAVSPLAAFATLPQIAISSEAAVRNGALLMMDTVLPTEDGAMGGKTVTLRTPTTAPAWVTDDWAIGFRAQAEYAFTDHFAYTLGGYKADSGNPTTAEVFVAGFGKDGAMAPGVATTALPTPVTFGEATAVDDYLFVAGGRDRVFGASGSTAVYAAHALPDGTLEAWQPVAALPMGRTNHELAVLGDFLVVTGGAVNGPGDANVFVARVRFPE
jgi:hypothetical protein